MAEKEGFVCILPLAKLLLTPVFALVSATVHRTVVFKLFKSLINKKTTTKLVVVFMAEKEGFEPSKPFWGLHDFQSCALGQLRDFSI